MTTPATPRPWTTRVSENGQMVYIENAAGNVVCSFSRDFGEANAALIVEAVNNHDQLREDNVILKQLAGEGAQKIEELRAEHAEMVEFLKGLDHTPPKGVTFKQFVRGGAGRLLARLDRAK